MSCTEYVLLGCNCFECTSSRFESAQASGKAAAEPSTIGMPNPLLFRFRWDLEIWGPANPGAPLPLHGPVPGMCMTKRAVNQPYHYVLWYSSKHWEPTSAFFRSAQSRLADGLLVHSVCTQFGRFDCGSRSSQDFILNSGTAAAKVFQKGLVGVTWRQHAVNGLIARQVCLWYATSTYIQMLVVGVMRYMFR